jgi:nucleoid-associated protein YgaU
MKHLTLVMMILSLAALGCDTPPLEDPVEDHDSLHQCDPSVCEPTPAGAEAEATPVEPAPPAQPDQPVEVVVKEVPNTVQPYTGPVEEEPDAPADAGYATYTVTDDDTGGYWGIAQKLYGAGKYWYLIAEANPDVDSTLLRVGMELAIPPLPEGD